MSEQDMAGRVRHLLSILPRGVSLVGAAKTRTAAEVQTAIRAGLRIIGHNYVQEAAGMREALSAVIADTPTEVKWHLIGHLQRNKARRAVELFDMIETIDSLRTGRAVSRHCEELGKIMPVLVEVNSAGEANKSGVLPDETAGLIRELAQLPNLRVEGLMTMGPVSGDPEEARPYFRATKALFDDLHAAELPNVSMRHLSMGMSNSYAIALEEGASIVRIGTRLFGPRTTA